MHAQWITRAMRQNPRNAHAFLIEGVFARADYGSSTEFAMIIASHKGWLGMTALLRSCCACALTLALYACGFEHGQLPPDASAPTITVSFGTAPTMVDEASGTVMIPVVLSGVATTEITVDYAVGTGTATRPDDFTLTDGTLRFM